MLKLVMTNKLQELASQYLSWQIKGEEAEKELDSLKAAIVEEAGIRKVKKIKSGQVTLYIITQQETRFPQLGEPGRKEVEKIVKKSGELKNVVIFDIVRLGNAYDEKRLSGKLMEKLKSFAKKEKTIKIVVKKRKITP